LLPSSFDSTQIRLRDVMNSQDHSSWYIVGYVRPIPGVLSFVFPVVQNENVPDSKGAFACDGHGWAFVEPPEDESFVRIRPVALPGVTDLQVALPIFGYEYIAGSAWFGDACELSKVLIEFAGGRDALSAGARSEIARFVWGVAMREEVVSGEPILVQASSVPTLEAFDAPRILVAGVGGGGCNIIEHMIAHHARGVELACLNTDAHALRRTGARIKIQLGQPGLGAGGRPEVARLAAEECLVDIRQALSGVNLLFVTAGLGAGTGTGAAPVVACAAREMGILTVGVVTRPFEFEGRRRAKQAEDGISTLEACVDSLIVLRNEKLLELLDGNVTQLEAFAASNEVVKNAICAISDIVQVPGLVNVDLADINTVLRESGQAGIGTASAGGPNRASAAAEGAIASPLLDGASLASATGVLVLVSASRASLKLAEARTVIEVVRKHVADDAHVIFGTASDETLGEQLRVSIILAGLRKLPVPVNRPLLPVAMVPPGPAKPAALVVLGHSPAAEARASVTSFEGLTTPSVWRRMRSEGAERRGTTPSDRGMEEIEIPAFLRKQAD